MSCLVKRPRRVVRGGPAREGGEGGGSVLMAVAALRGSRAVARPLHDHVSRWCVDMVCGDGALAPGDSLVSAYRI